MKKIIGVLVLVNLMTWGMVQGGVAIFDTEKMDQMPIEIKVILLETALNKKNKESFDNIARSLQKEDLHKAVENYLSELDEFDTNFYTLAFLEGLRDDGIKVHGWTFLSRAIQRMADMIFLDKIHTEADLAVYENLRKRCDVLVEMGADVHNREILLYNWTHSAISFLQDKGMNVASHLDWYLEEAKNHYSTWYYDGRDQFIREFLSIVKNLNETKYVQLMESKEALPLLLGKGDFKEVREFITRNNITQEIKNEMLKLTIARKDYMMMKVLLNYGAKAEDKDVETIFMVTEMFDEL